MVNPGSAGLTLCHKGSNGISKATLPDVCWTPSPGGPVAVAYPNIAFSRDLEKGTTTVKADGGNMCANNGSVFNKSTGDEAGTLGGVISGTVAAEACWMTYSFDVKLEGKGACRLTDKMFHNHWNTMNMEGELQARLTPIPCSAEEMKSNVAKCNVANKVLDKTTEVIGQDPSVAVEPIPGARGSGGRTDFQKKKITIAPNPDCCGATQTLIMELTNMGNLPKAAEIQGKAAAGDLSRSDYVREIEKTEYEGIKNATVAFDQCGAAWGCSPGALARYEAYRGAKDADDYADKYAREQHKDHYREQWDANYKAAYEQKHPII